MSSFLSFSLSTHQTIEIFDVISSQWQDFQIP